MGGRSKGGGADEDGRRRYPHVERARDPVKRSHNDWVVASAVEHGSDVLILDGLDLNTTTLLIRAGVASDAIHVPNRPDFDALMKRERATFGGGAAGAAPATAVGHVYRATAQEWVEAYGSLAAPVRPVKTVWLDLNARWGLHVERTLKTLFESRMLGHGASDLFLTLSRGFHAQQLDAVADLVPEIFAAAYGGDGATLTLVEDHTANYGTGMMILHWRVAAPAPLYDRLFGPTDAVPLADRLAKETKAFRKPQNMRRARTGGDGAVAVVCLGDRGSRGDGDDGDERWLSSFTACACADMTSLSVEAAARNADVPLTDERGNAV